MKHRIVNVAGTKRTGLFPSSFILASGSRKFDLHMKEWRDVPELTTAMKNFRDSGHLFVIDLPISETKFKDLLSSLDREGPSLLAASELEDEVKKVEPPEEPPVTPSVPEPFQELPPPAVKESDPSAGKSVLARTLRKRRK